MSDAIAPIIEALQRVLPTVPATSISEAVKGLVQGQRATLGSSSVSLTFGEGNTFDQTTISVGDIAGGDIIKLTVQLPQPLDPIPMALATFASMPITVLPEPSTQLPLSSRMALARNPHFVGRVNELLSLARAIADPQPAVITSAIATGLGGIGKTNLATEFVYRYGQYFHGGVFWLNCADLENVPLEIAACGRSGHLNLYREQDGLSLDEQTAMVLAAWREPIPRLLIFDDCNDIDVLLRWRPISGGCRILITTRQGSWSEGHQITLKPLARSESIKLLQSLPTALDELSADTIADIVDDLPLALHLAGCYLRRYGAIESVALYIDRLKSQNVLGHPALKGRGLSSGEILPTRHEQDVARTFALSFDRLDPESSVDAVALTILRRICFLAPGEPTPLSFLWKLLPSLAVHDAFEALERVVQLGLIDYEGQASVKVHRLLHAFFVIAFQDLNDDSINANQILDIIEDCIDKGNVRYIHDIYLHIYYVYTKFQSNIDEFAEQFNASLGNYHYLYKNYKDAKKFFERSLHISDSLNNANSFIIIERLNSLILCLREMGLYDELDKYMFRLNKISYGNMDLIFNIIDQKPGVDEKVDIKSMFDLLPKGILAYDDPDKMFESLQGSNMDSPVNFIQSMINSDFSLNSEINKFIEKIMGEMEGEFSIENLFSFAKNLQNNALDSLDESLQASLHRAKVYEEKGLLNDAEILYRKSLSTTEYVFGLENVQIISIINNLANILTLKQDYIEAEQLYQRALLIRKNIFGENNQETALSLNNLGALMFQWKRYDEARIFLQDAAHIFMNYYESHHPSFVTVLCNLAAVSEACKDYGSAVKFYQQALLLAEDIRGLDHPDTFNVLNHLARLHLDQGKYEDAIVLLQRVLAAQQTRDFENSQYLESRFLLIKIYYAQKRIVEAESLIDESIQLSERFLIHRPYRLAIILHNIGLVLYDQGDVARFEHLLRRALGLFADAGNLSHTNAITTLSILANVLYDLERYEDAESYYREALTHQRIVLGEEHQDVASSLHNIGMSCFKQNRLAEAESLLISALAMYEVLLGPDDELTMHSRNRLKMVQETILSENPE